VGANSGYSSERWIADHVGTIHTFQGREADTVILVLGAPERSHTGAGRWAGATPNILNVAVSRARKNLYVIGSRGAWSGAGAFSVLAQVLPSDK
jgi:superfamily I DNA and/or RNA helicase